MLNLTFVRIDLRLCTTSYSVQFFSHKALASLGRFAMPSTPTDDVAEAVISAQQILVKRSATESCKISD